MIRNLSAAAVSGWDQRRMRAAQERYREHADMRHRRHSLNRTFVQARDSGRHFHLHPWRKVPIARYDRRNPEHAGLIRLALACERVTDTWLNTKAGQDNELSQVAGSAHLRRRLHEQGYLSRIDDLAKALLPAQCHED